jgi:hypothetical protein
MSITDSRSHFDASPQQVDPRPVLVSLGGFCSQRQHLIEQWGPEAEIDVCRWSTHQWFNKQTGEVGARIRCRRNSCLSCVRVLARQLHEAVKLAQPSHLATLTALSGDWQTDRKMVNRLRYYLRDRDGLTFAFAWAVEPNPRNTGHHAHGWVWGDPIPRGRFQYRANQVGFGITQLKTVTHSGNFAYVLKNATHNARSLDEHIRLNGREPIHARGFWRDATTGEALTKAEAIRRSHPGWQADWDDWVAMLAAPLEAVTP